MFAHHHDPSALLVHVHMYTLGLCGKGTQSGICRVPPEKMAKNGWGRGNTGQINIFLDNLKTAAISTL